MSMIFVPKSAQAQVPFAASDFPCVKHFFPCEEVAGTNTLSDIVGDVVINYAGLARTADGYGADTSSVGAQDTSGTWSVPGSKLWVMLVVGKYSNTVTSTLTFGVNGSLTQDRIAMTGSAMTVTANNGNTVVDGTDVTLPANTVIGGRAMVLSAYDNAAGFKTYQFDTETVGSLLGTVGTDAASTGAVSAYSTGAGLEMGTGGFQLGGAASALYGIVWLEFTTLPADLLVGLAWMTNRFANGEKVIYPAWKGVS